MPLIVRHPQRLPLLALGMGALLAGMAAGLVRLGWTVPLLPPGLSVWHGPLMVSGFLGTLISLERAVALGRGWAYAVPAVTGLGGMVLIAGGPLVLAQTLFTVGSVGLVAIFLAIIQRQSALYTWTMAAGACLWVIGNVLWLAGRPLFFVVWWWAAFLLVTIAGERLELARLQQPAPAAQALFLVLLALLTVGLVMEPVWYDVGVRLCGGAVVGMAWWLSRYDIARHTVAQQGLPRFVAVGLLIGYGWLGISGLSALWFGGVPAGPAYDLTLHAFFLGFVFSMIFAHAPIIFPAVLGARMNFTPRLYLHVGLLHLTLAVRLLGDALGWSDARQLGGLLNAVTVVVFLVNTVSTLRPAAVRATPAPIAGPRQP